MRLQLRKPAQSLHKAHARQAVAREQMNRFRRALAELFSRTSEKESEEYQKRIVADFFREAFDADVVDESPQESVDLVIQAKPDTPATGDKMLPHPIGSSAVVEVRKVFAAEMMTPLKNNVRALHELILYYFENAERDQPRSVHQLIITDVYNWFLFDEADFRRFFYNNARLKKLYQVKQQQKKENTFFFTEAARILRELDAEIPVTYLNLRETADSLNRFPEQNNRALVTAFKLFSPEHLFERPLDSSTGSFNPQFYEELLWIVGIREIETARNGTRLDRLSPDERAAGSWLENTIQQLQARYVLESGGDWSEYGADKDEQLFTIALTLCLTWLHRIFLLNVYEKQVGSFYTDGLHTPFLSARSIPDFASLNELFGLIPVPIDQRPGDVLNRFGDVPYLNCTLFDKTDLEQKTLTVDALTDTLELPIFEQTGLSDPTDEPPGGPLTTLPYLLALLDAYDFLAEGSVPVFDERKPGISATTLSLTLERLNNRRRGLLSIPADVTASTVREVVRRIVLAKFTQLPEPVGSDIPNLADATSIDDLRQRFSYGHQPDTLLRLNTVFNSLRIVDPAVGSGQFIVSALNELIALKAQLGILIDPSGQRWQKIRVDVVNGELLITNDDGELFAYSVTDSDRPAFSFFERQRIQKTIFHEKQQLIENCLFGVDRTPSSLATYQLRLWIELMKSLYRPGSEPQYLSASTDQAAIQTWSSETNDSYRVNELRLALNSRAGNSLVSRLRTDFQIDSLNSLSAREKLGADLRQYKADRWSYPRSQDNAEKQQIRARMGEFEESIGHLVLTDQKEVVAIRRLEAKLAQSTLPFEAVDTDDRFRQIRDKLAARKNALASQQNLFRQAVEWRFMFPEVLDDEGRYVGFDGVIGSPAGPQSDKLSAFRSYFAKAFPNTYTSQVEPYALFIELGLGLLKPDGYLAYVLPSKWTQAGAAGKLRNWLKTRHIEQVLDYSSLPATDQNASSTSVLFVSNTEATPTFQAVKIDALNRNADNAAVTGQTVEIAVASLQDMAWKLFTANN